MSIHRLLLASAAITLGATMVPGATAHAAVPETATCAGSQTVTYSPGLTARSRHVTINGTTTLSRCASPADPTITGGTSTFTADGIFSCTSGTYSGVRKIAWNNGRTSTLSFTSLVSVRGPESVVAIRGTVTGGEFSGQKWSGAFTMFTAKPLACGTPAGLPTASGPLLLSIGSLLPGLVVPHKSRPVGL
jgi:hypothetical protein